MASDVITWTVFIDTSRSTCSVWIARIASSTRLVLLIVACAILRISQRDWTITSPSFSRATITCVLIGTVKDVHTIIFRHVGYSRYFILQRLEFQVDTGSVIIVQRVRRGLN